MKRLYLLCILCLIASCSHSVRCDGHLQPINSLKPAQNPSGSSDRNNLDPRGSTKDPGAHGHAQAGRP